ncbi:MAG: glutamyl-tRNA reductase [Thermodesulfobacteriota bacterium]|nr:glutamyl-tRNA reductase [Thermodesulfobacteriota bacterium]
MDIIVVGLNHKTAPIEMRERLHFPSDNIEEPLKKLTNLSYISEGLILSTCNRVEVMAVTRDPEKGINEIKNFLSSYHNVPKQQLDSCLYSYESDDAIRHVFKVASSLDSMVVGEPQILGQLKDAYRMANRSKTSGLILHKFLHKAFSVGKKVRTESMIATSAVSISFAAVELAKKIFDDLKYKVIMLIGSGEMSELAARHLMNNGVKEILIANRTRERAEKLAREFRGRTVVFEDLALFLDQVDIVISSTSSPHYTIGYNDIVRSLKIRKFRPIFLIDIAVPRNIDPKINDIDNIYLYDIDDMQGVVDANIKARSEEAKKAERIIEKEVGKFDRWLKSLSVVPTIISLKQRLEDIRKKEVEKVIAGLNGNSQLDRELLNNLTSSIINKILHSPLTQLKRQEDTRRRDYYIDAIRNLFNLE